jgi:predicted metal-dependent peptidase
MNDRPFTIDFANLVSGSLLRLRMKSPFFGTLAMFAQFVPSTTISAAATDGRNIFCNPEFLQSLPTPQQDGLLLHEILHAALLHPLRLRERDPYLWNIAADIIVNGTILRQVGFELPPGALRDERLEHLSVEEVYELLRTTGAHDCQLADLDLLAPHGEIVAADLDAIATPSASTTVAHTPEDRELYQPQVLTAHWQQAIDRAIAIASTTQSGKFSPGIDRAFTASLNPPLDWRAHLWRYLAQTPTDFQGFDRRFVGWGLYLEALRGESVRVYLAIDTSGSVSETALGVFMSEARGILGAYPHLECDLYYVDSEADGPYPLTLSDPLPTPQGGGSTSFVPFFERVAATWDGHTPALCIYLTDGYGEFPTIAPILPTLWVVTAGGLDLAQFPFGEAVGPIDRA